MKRIITLFFCVMITSALVTVQAQDKFEFGLGLKIDEAKYNKVQLAHVSRGDFTALPSKVSLKKYCPIPGSQGKTGTCVAWSSTYGARTIIYAMENNITDKQKITQTAFSPSFVYNQIKEKGDANCKAGT